ncbi:metacaspase-9-like [Triticum dicoccoides]|uniref:metacaspase-9-like n=1 Tax=Triticum dicoccoides TaxID=85692 RepID=UPI001890F3EB|nr:metacaspase-9-like [Triticum dicoccoides]
MLLLATLVGCNYAGTRRELSGCINDVFLMRQILVRQFGFEERNVTVLIDNNTHLMTEPPTGANIKRALDRMVQRARGVRRAHLFFHFSGHGTLLRGGPYGRPHDAIMPSDSNLITDVDFRRLVDQVPQTATFTMVSDSCHSGGLIAQEREQIGPTASALNRAGGGGGRRTRFLPYETVLQHLGVANLHQLERHMVATFGDDASALFRHARAPVPVPRPNSAILLSACQLDESADEQDNYGAFTLALSNLLRGPNDVGNHWEVVTLARSMLQQRGHTQQHPCLYCSNDNVGRLFLS